jgi:hypothetical protein
MWGGNILESFSEPMIKGGGRSGSCIRLTYGWVVKLFGTYYQGNVFESRRHQICSVDKSLTAVCLGSITRTMHMDYVWHTPTLVISQCVRGWLNERTLCQVGLFSRATASNNCRKDIGLSKLSVDSTLYCKVAERVRYFCSSSVGELK